MTKDEDIKKLFLKEWLNNLRTATLNKNLHLVVQRFLILMPTTAQVFVDYTF